MTKCANCNWSDTGRNERLCEMKRLLSMSARYRDQTEGRGAITGLLHALRTAGFARGMGLDREAQFVGLVHDLARPLNDVHHGEIVAEMVRDRVSATAYEVLRTHGEFQSSYVHHRPFPVLSSAEAQNLALQLAECEVASFDPERQNPVRFSLRDAHHLIEEFLA